MSKQGELLPSHVIVFFQLCLSHLSWLGVRLTKWSGFACSSPYATRRPSLKTNLKPSSKRMGAQPTPWFPHLDSRAQNSPLICLARYTLLLLVQNSRATRGQLSQLLDHLCQQPVLADARRSCRHSWMGGTPSSPLPTLTLSPTRQISLAKMT